MILHCYSDDVSVKYTYDPTKIWVERDSDRTLSQTVENATISRTQMRYNMTYAQ